MATPFTMLDTITREEIMPTLEDVFFNRNILWKTLKDRERPLSGGDVIEQPVMYRSNPDAGAWGGGYETLPLNQHDFITKAQHGWAHYVVPLSYAETDQIKNMGDAQIIDLAEATATNGLQTLRETLGTDLYADGSNNAKGKKRFDGLGAILTRNGNPAPGSYGGISRTSSNETRGTYTNTNSWWNAMTTAIDGGAVNFWTGQFTFSNSTNVLDLFRFNLLYVALVSRDDDGPDIIVTSPVIFAKLWQLVQVNERIKGGEETGKAGSKYIMINGTAVISDTYIDAATKIIMLNSRYIFLRPSKVSNFKNSGVRKPSRMRIVASYIFWDGNLTCSHPGAQGQLTNVGV